MFSNTLENLFSGFEPKNIQPSLKAKENDKNNYDWRTNLPVCPFYQLVEICSQFAGIPPEKLATEPRFCGCKTKHIDDMEIPLCGRCGTEYTPLTSCINIRDTLIEQLALVKTEITLPSEKNNKIQKDPILLEKKLIEEAQLVQSFNQKQKILKIWRDSVYEICCIPSEQPNQEHFLARSKDQLTDEFVINRVNTFLTALENNVTGRGIHPEDKSFNFGQIENRFCKQAPGSNFIGAIS
jgi:hypothetical protein